MSKKKKTGDNPAIGIILCSDKNETMVKYTMLEDKKGIFASKYRLYLPSEGELKKELIEEKEKIRSR
ncbi:MAG: PDDEXK nuclease domain-containing protein [Nanoarchaeota archaeon]